MSPDCSRRHSRSAPTAHWPVIRARVRRPVRAGGRVSIAGSVVSSSNPPVGEPALPWTRPSTAASRNARHPNIEMGKKQVNIRVQTAIATTSFVRSQPSCRDAAAIHRIWRFYVCSVTLISPGEPGSRDVRIHAPWCRSLAVSLAVKPRRRGLVPGVVRSRRLVHVSTAELDLLGLRALARHLDMPTQFFGLGTASEVHRSERIGAPSTCSTDKL